MTFWKRARLPKKSFRLKDCLDLITARYFETTSRVVPVPVCDRISAAIALAGLSHSAPFFCCEKGRGLVTSNHYVLALSARL